MGEFLVRHVDHQSGVEMARFAARNVLAHEGLEYVYRQLFPPYQDSMSFQIGVSGPNAGYPDDRPNIGGGTSFGPHLTFEACTNTFANEGGCYTDEMRASFGYARQAVEFAASMEADGGAFVSPEVEFPNNHSWFPQDASDWDLPWVEDIIEQPPPEWFPKKSWEPVVGYPWQRPRKRCGTDCNPENPDDCVYSYMHEWDPSGDLDWLCDLRTMGGFPITLAFLFDALREKLIAAAQFRAPVLLRPGTTLYVKYRARIFGKRLTRDFALRFARYAFERAGDRYDTIYCRPLLAEAPPPNRRTTYGEIEAYFHPHFAPVELASWAFVAGSPPRVESSDMPQWPNTSGTAIGPFGWLAIYGTVADAQELMWFTQIDPPVSVPDGDTLRVPDRVRFELESI